MPSSRLSSESSGDRVAGHAGHEDRVRSYIPMTAPVYATEGRVLPCPTNGASRNPRSVDLGSNSFHLLVGRIVDGQIYPLDSLREPVQLGAGLTADKRLDRAVQARALEALARFPSGFAGCRGMPSARSGRTRSGSQRTPPPSSAKRARRSASRSRSSPAAKRHASFISGRAGAAAGREPASCRRHRRRLHGADRRRGLKPKVMESLYMGCVSSSLQHFPDGRIDKKSLKAAALAARQELASSRAATCAPAGRRPSVPPEPHAASRASSWRTSSRRTASRAKGSTSCGTF